ALYRCRQLLVGQRVRPLQSAHQPAHQESARPARARDVGRLQPSAGGRAVRTTGGAHPAGTGAGVLHRQWLDRYRGRAEDELPLLAQLNGSTGIEVALKMSFHYWRNSGQPTKQRFVTLTNSYHGETVAAMSVGDVALFTDTYKPLLLDTFKVLSPDCYLRPEGMSWEEHSRNMF